MKASLRATLGICLLIAAMLAPAATAQQTTSTIRGVVVDASDAPIADAEVTVLDTRTGATKDLTTDANGVFLATRLSPGGPYIVIVDELETVEVPSIAVADIYSLKLTVNPGRPDDVAQNSQLRAPTADG